METDKITLRLRSSYGRERIYPICQRARLLCRLTGRITFLAEDLETLAKLGYNVNWEAEPAKKP